MREALWMTQKTDYQTYDCCYKITLLKCYLLSLFKTTEEEKKKEYWSIGQRRKNQDS